MSTQVAPKPSAADRVAQMANGFLISSAIGAVVRLNVAETIGDGEMTIEALAKKVGAKEDALYRVMRLLASLEIFEMRGDKTFANNDGSAAFRHGAKESQRGFIEFITDPFHMNMYADMVPTLKDGRTAVEHVTGKKCFDVFEADKDEQRRFDDAMTCLSKRAVPAILGIYDFSGIETLVDIAGGHGMLLTAVLQKYPQMKGILFDLPHVAPGAEKRIAELGLSDRCSTTGGDFFKSVPKADAYMMKHILHDWPDEECVTILKNCRAAMSDKGARKVLVLEMIVPDKVADPHPSYFLDIEMLMLPGGKERTEAEFAALFERAGFKLSRVARSQSPNCVIEAVPV
jgi:hypothetical protein